MNGWVYYHCLWQIHENFYPRLHHLLDLWTQDMTTTTIFSMFDIMLTLATNKQTLGMRLRFAPQVLPFWFQHLKGSQACLSSATTVPCKPQLYFSPVLGVSFQSLNRTRSQCWPGVLWRCATFHADPVPIDDLRFLDGLRTAYDRGSTLDRRTHFDDVWLSNCREVFNAPTRPCPSNTTLRIVHDQSKNIMTK